MLRIEKEKNLQNEEENRRQIDEIKKLQEERIRVIKQEFDLRLQAQIEANPISSNASSNNNNNEQKKDAKSKTEKILPNENFELHEDVKKKERLAKKWRAEYRILKIKLEERETVEKNKNQESDKYYQQYIEFKHRNKALEAKNEGMKKQIEELAEKLKKTQKSNVEFMGRTKKETGKYTYETNVAKREVKDLKAQV